jgi:hypothetical protein
MIRSCTIFYNDGPDLLKRCLLSLKERVDEVFAIDGRFHNFPGDFPWSTDGCLEIAKEFATVIECKEPWINQIAKRNAYLTLENANDYYLIVDADEYLESAIDAALVDDVYALKVGKDASFDWQCRLFRNIEGIKYKKKHSWIWNKDKIINQMGYNDGIKKLDYPVVIHNPDLRSEKRQEQDTQYVKDRKEPETIPYLLTPVRRGKVVYPLKDTRIICVKGPYSGFDLDSTYISLNTGQSILVCKLKAEQLKKDYPSQFKIMEK